MECLDKVQLEPHRQQLRFLILNETKKQYIVVETDTNDINQWYVIIKLLCGACTDHDWTDKDKTYLTTNYGYDRSSHTLLVHSSYSKNPNFTEQGFVNIGTCLIDPADNKPIVNETPNIASLKYMYIDRQFQEEQTTERYRSGPRTVEKKPRRGIYTDRGLMLVTTYHHRHDARTVYRDPIYMCIVNHTKGEYINTSVKIMDVSYCSPILMLIISLYSTYDWEEAHHIEVTNNLAYIEHLNVVSYNFGKPTEEALSDYVEIYNLYNERSDLFPEFEFQMNPIAWNFAVNKLAYKLANQTGQY